MKSHAKINLTLEVISKRKDGYHNIKSIVSKIDLHDNISIKKLKQNKIEIICKNKKVPIDKNNTIYQTLMFLKNKYNIETGYKIILEKNIPLESGLGGASSNAAVVLQWFCKEYNKKITKKLIKEVSKVGADIPLFLTKGTVLISGIGEKVKNIQTPKISNDIYILKPKKTTSTQHAYEKIKPMKTKIYKGMLKKIKNKIFLTNKDFYNSFCFITKKEKNKLKKFGFEIIQTTGSGSALIAIGKIDQGQIKKIKQDYTFIYKTKIIRP